MEAPSTIARRYRSGVGEHYWEGDEPHFLTVAPSADASRAELSLYGARSKTSRQLASIPLDAGLKLFLAGIAPDGRRVAFWFGDYGKVDLHLIDTRAATGRVVYTESKQPHVGALGISDDGRRIAWQVWHGDGPVGLAILEVP